MRNQEFGFLIANYELRITHYFFSSDSADGSACIEGTAVEKCWEP